LDEYDHVPLTTKRYRTDNAIVRRLLLAVLFCLTAWVAFAQILPPSAGATIGALADGSSENEAEAPDRDDEPDGYWNAGCRASVSITESLWKSSVVHADLAAARSGDVFIGAGRRQRPDNLAPSRSPHLLHVPLLI